jgi:DNA-binding IclR family transcriptional regulator
MGGTPRRPRSRPDKPVALVKSAARVFRILEYLDDVREGAMERDVANALDLPQSSTGALLHTMAHLGYLRRDPATGFYSLSARVPMLGHGVKTDFVRPGPLLDMLTGLRRKTGVSVALSRRQGGAAQHIFRLLKTGTPRHPAPLGAYQPLYRSVPGAALLGTADTAEMDRQMRRAAAEDRRDKANTHSAWWRDVIATVDKHGYAYGRSTTLEGIALIAAALPRSFAQEAMAVSVFADEGEMGRNRDRYAKILLSDIHEYAAANAD